jgi:hypothetical protein
MGLIDKTKIFEKILKLKFQKQTQEVKKKVQELQQKIDNLTNGSK